MGIWISVIWLNLVLWSGSCGAMNSSSPPYNHGVTRGRALVGNEIDSIEKSKSKYFKSFRKIYGGSREAMPACLLQHKDSGWIPSQGEADLSHLPLYVIAVGPEASGHQMWKMLLENSVFDCIWVTPSPPLASPPS